MKVSSSNMAKPIQKIPRTTIKAVSVIFGLVFIGLLIFMTYLNTTTGTLYNDNLKSSLPISQPYEPSSPTMVYVASHPRAGTHLTMNTVQNFFVNTKAHKLNHYAADEVLTCECIRAMTQKGYILYVERNFSSVLESHYYYFKDEFGFFNTVATKDTTLEQYLESNKWYFAELAWRWRHTSDTWTSLANAHPDRIRKVHYLDLAKPTNETLDELRSFLKVQRKEVPDQKWKGVKVGKGKGMVESSQNVIDTANQALRDIRMLYDPHMYEMTFYFFGKPLAPELECEPSFTTCPAHSDVLKAVASINSTKLVNGRNRRKSYIVAQPATS